ncbi:hypothetical protein M407DRAFT_17923 [Tulasnella calospora MUT 4182]|uniref:Uncharacterized protein n=1 Tax=Tulasnella calospora MUT 4182 TaxID=1051891 RepID=A0A0C3QL51_9AGAM|nr:hypothetical protein M407DRAFT_17923 [Tulasnella calospora MUT 4182]
MDQRPAIIVVCVALALLLFLVVSACTRARRSPVLPQHRGHVQHPVAYVPVQGHPRLQQAIHGIQSMQNGIIPHAQSSNHLGPWVLLVQDSISYARSIQFPTVAFPRRTITAGTANDRTSTDTLNQIVAQPARASRHPRGRRYGNRLVPATCLGPIPVIVSSSGGIPGAPCSADINLNQDPIARFCISPPGSMGPGAVCLGAKPPPSATLFDTHTLDIGAAH